MPYTCATDVNFENDVLLVSYFDKIASNVALLCITVKIFSLHTVRVHSPKLAFLK